MPPGRHVVRALDAAGARFRALAALSFSRSLHQPGAGIPAGTDEMCFVLHLLSHGASWRTLDFLGFHHRRVRGERGYEHLRFLARWPSPEAMSRARQRIRELTARNRTLLGEEVIVQELNEYLRGWANYYRYGNSRRHFTKIRTYALKRLVLFAAKRRDRTTRYGWTVVNYHSRNQLGLITLEGLVITPGPFRDWRTKRATPNAPGERRR